MVPSGRPPMVRSWTWARPWTMASMFSLRVSTQRTGRPQRRASQGTSRSSGWAPALARTPADVGGDDPHLARLQAEGARHHGVDAVGVLGGAPHDQAAVDPGGGRGPHLQRAGGQPLVDDPLADDDLAGLGPLALGRRVAEGTEPVGAEGGEQHGLVVERLVEVGDRRQGLVVDRHHLGGVGALLGRSVSTTATGSPTNRTRSVAR